MPRMLIVSLCLLVTAGCNQTRGTGAAGGFYSGYDASSGYAVGTDASGGQAAATAAPTACLPAEDAAGRIVNPQLRMPPTSAVTGVAFDPASGALMLQTADEIRIWDPRQGQQRDARPLRAVSAPIPFSASAQWPEGGISLHVNWLKGSLDIFSNRDGVRMGEVWLTRDGWAVLDTAGRFDADPRQWTQWVWEDGAERLDFTQLADLYFEPSLLGKLAVGAELDTPEAPDISVGFGLPPHVSIQLDRADQWISGSLAVRERGGCIGAVRLFHNGKAVSLQAPTRRAGRGDTEIWDFSVPRHAGENRIRALATNTRKVESAAAETSVAGGPATGYRPRAHILVVAVDEYSNPALRLNFAVADGRGMAAWAKALPSGPQALFEDVFVTELYDRQATRKRILDELTALQQVDPRDTVLVYLAGHGENDGVKWYFLPTEFGRSLTFEAIADEGVSSTRLRDALVQIPARRLGLVVDACKSGDMRRVFSAATDGRYLEWVGRTAGIQLLAATDQQQLAVELTELGHGALTYTLLQGVDGDADSLPKDRLVMANELFRYSQAELPGLTERIVGEAQIPVLFEYGADFPLQAIR